MSEPSLIDQCNGHCGCLTSEFNPVCVQRGQQRLAYYSPCFAGCSSQSLASVSQLKFRFINTVCPFNATWAFLGPQPRYMVNSDLLWIVEAVLQTYSNCSCVPGDGIDFEVLSGYCETQCGGLTLFLVLFAPFVFCTFAVGVPLISVILRFGSVKFQRHNFMEGSNFQYFFWYLRVFL